MQKEMFSHRSDRTNTFQVQLYVQLRTVPNAIITDDTQPRTPNQFSIILRLHHAVRPPVFFSDRVKRYRRSSSWEEDRSPPCLCRPVPSLTEGPEQTSWAVVARPEIRTMTIFWIYLNLTLTNNLSETWTATNCISVCRTYMGISSWRRR